jgi:hypothetical protein
MSSSDNPQNPPNPQDRDPNRQQQPGLWTAHAEYIKGAAEVRLPLPIPSQVYIQSLSHRSILTRTCLLSETDRARSAA